MIFVHSTYSNSLRVYTLSNGFHVLWCFIKFCLEQTFMIIEIYHFEFGNAGLHKCTMLMIELRI